MLLSKNLQTLIRLFDSCLVGILIYFLAKPKEQIVVQLPTGPNYLENLLWLFLLLISVFYIFYLKEKFRIVIFLSSLVLSVALYFLGTSMPFNPNPNSSEFLIFTYSITLSFLAYPILHILTNIYLLIVTAK